MVPHTDLQVRARSGPKTLRSGSDLGLFSQVNKAGGRNESSSAMSEHRSSSPPAVAWPRGIAIPEHAVSQAKRPEHVATLIAYGAALALGIRWPGAMWILLLLVLLFSSLRLVLRNWRLILLVTFITLLPGIGWLAGFVITVAFLVRRWHFVRRTWSAISTGLFLYFVPPTLMTIAWAESRSSDSVGWLGLAGLAAFLTGACIMHLGLLRLYNKGYSTEVLAIVSAGPLYIVLLALPFVHFAHHFSHGDPQTHVTGGGVGPGQTGSVPPGVPAPYGVDPQPVYAFAGGAATATVFNAMHSGPLPTADPMHVTTADPGHGDLGSQPHPTHLGQVVPAATTGHSDPYAGDVHGTVGGIGQQPTYVDLQQNPETGDVHGTVGGIGQQPTYVDLQQNPETGDVHGTVGESGQVPPSSGNADANPRQVEP
jgi:hypothetical protein